MIRNVPDPFLIPLEEIAAVVKAHAHDVRNSLNGMELEFTLLEENAGQPELKGAVKRLRAEVAHIDRMVRHFSAKYTPERAAPVSALNLAERWKADSARLYPAEALLWEIQMDESMLLVEVGLTRSLLHDLLAIASRNCRQQRLSVRCHREGGAAVFEVAVEKSAAPIRGDELQLIVWNAMCRLSARNHGSLQPENLAGAAFPLRLTLPVQPGTTN